MASRYCRFASKYWRIAGVALAGIDGTGEDIRSYRDAAAECRWREYNIEPIVPTEAPPLVILALDTTTRAGSVAVAREGRLLHQTSGDPALTHGQRLPGDMMAALAGAGVGVGDLNLLAVASGPGSFTGLRVGVAAVQGLAMARGLKVVPVSTLEALARAAEVQEGTGEAIAAWIDGQRGEVFAALYGAAGPTTTRPPMAGNPDAVLEAWALPAGDRPIVFIGDGAIRYRALLATRLGTRARVLEPPALAPIIARIAFEEPQRAIAPHAVVPIYVRRPDAELARERRRNSGTPDPGIGTGEGKHVNDVQPVIERVSSGHDLDDVAALEAACFTNPWTREMLERELHRSDVARVYVLKDGAGGVAAFCTCWIILDELHINTIGVDPARRRQGLASTLMRHVMEAAARSGARRATLEVRASNNAARRLYERLGFVESAVRPQYYSQPEEDAIILWRDGLAPDP